VFFLWGPPPLREGLEGKNQSFRVSRGLEKEERKENIYICSKFSSNINPTFDPYLSSFGIELIWLNMKIHWKK